MRTSHTHPLQIAKVAAPNGGVIGVTFCPGKCQPFAATGAWARDLEVDVDAIKAWGADLAISLVTAEELAALQVEGLGQALRVRGIEWLHLPIEDFSIPTTSWEAEWRASRAKVHALLDHGGRVLVHCKGGLGRAGLVSALLLIERGDTARAAIAKVRAARSPDAIETAEQVSYLMELRGAIAVQAADDVAVSHGFQAAPRTGGSLADEPYGGEFTHRFPLLHEALDYAAEAHQHQTRKGTTIAYLSHLLGVASLVIEHGGDEAQAIAALLHDVVEDCGAARAADVRKRFGDRVADIVLACTDGVPDATGAKPLWQARKLAYLQHLQHDVSDDALLVSACDKLHNARAIAADAACGQAVFERFTAGRDGTLWYYKSLLEVFEARLGRGSSLAIELRWAVERMASLC